MREADKITGAVDAVRLTIRYGGDRFEIVKRRPVRKSVRPSAPLLENEQETGVWAEVRRDGRCLYRQLLVNALGRDVEVFTTDLERPMARIPVADPVGTFTIVVPKLDADEIAIVGPPRRQAGRTARRSKADPDSFRVGDLAAFSMNDDGNDEGNDEGNDDENGSAQ